MPDAALYFPYIEVPERPSVTRVLLYWDRLGTIVPASVAHDIWPRTRKLVQCDLVETVDPTEYLRELDGFAEAFLELAEAATAGGAGAGRAVPIHKDKSIPRLWKALEQRGIVESGSEVCWMMVDERVAGIFLAYLAMCLGACCALEPITDKRASFGGVAVPAGLRFSAGLDVMRAVMLANVLPAPSTPVPPETIADFKHAYWDELRAFRLRVERALLDCIRASQGALSQERTTGRDEPAAGETIGAKGAAPGRAGVIARAIGPARPDRPRVPATLAGSIARWCLTAPPDRAGPSGVGSTSGSPNHMGGEPVTEHDVLVGLHVGRRAGERVGGVPADCGS